MKIKISNIICNLLILAISSIFFSCADSQDLTTHTIEDQSIISFDVDQNEFNTRTQDGINEFQVLGYLDNGITMSPDTRTYLGYADVNSYKPVDIVFNGSSWIYKNKSDMVYWPDGKLNFYATSNFDYLKAKRIDKKSPMFKLKIPNDIRKQKDIMFAVSYDVTKNTNNGRVNLTFYHLLEKILFKAYLGDPSYNIEIKDIILHNISDTLLFAPQIGRISGIKKRTVNLVPSLENNANFSIGISNPIKITATEKDKATLLNSYPLYIPLNSNNNSGLIKWEGNKTISDLDAKGITYLEIIYRFKINEKQIVPKTGDGYGSTYIPITQTNLGEDNGLGAQMTIYLKMGGGYDYNLKPILNTPPTIEISTDKNYEMSPEESEAKRHSW